MNGYSGGMSILVRKQRYDQKHRELGAGLTSPTQRLKPKRDSLDRVPQMACYASRYHAGYAERGLAGSVVHIQTEGFQ
jgi:hypothetical protein